eukprot:TRINITY_DN74732_c0_g1_i1.p1 TRINITY_DN74732_c0_g1~~TRINITY_DN74732_c0_g1_i1.p1  ORF type:complete len:345 (-),score=8.48 TRINITY_DN74732_c0_g1_i1:109-1143(-)
MWKFSIPKHLYGVCYMTGGSLLYSLMSVLMKVGTSFFGEWQLLCFRCAITTLISLFLLAYSKVNPLGPPDWRLRTLLLVRGLVGTIGLVGMIYALKLLPVGNATCISFTSPVFTTLFARLFLGEKYTKVDALGALGALIGVVLVSKPPFLYSFLPGLPALPPSTSSKNQELLGVLAALVMSTMTAVVYCTVRVIGTRVPVLVPVTWFCMTGTVVGLVVSLAIELPWQALTGTSVGVLAGIGVTGFFGQSFMTHALQIEKASTVSVCAYTQVLFAFIWQLLLFGDVPDWATWVGGLLVVSCVGTTVFQTWKKGKLQPKSPDGLLEEVNSTYTTAPSVNYGTINKP